MKGFGVGGHRQHGGLHFGPYLQGGLVVAQVDYLGLRVSRLAGLLLAMRSHHVIRRADRKSQMRCACGILDFLLAYYFLEQGANSFFLLEPIKKLNAVKKRSLELGKFYRILIFVGPGQMQAFLYILLSNNFALELPQFFLLGLIHP